MMRHVLPNVVAPVIVAFTITIGIAILVESGVSFLGLGVQPPTASWGKELRIGFTYLEAAPLFSIAPGVMISLAIISFNFVGDGLRDALDPRLRGTNWGRR
jgi:ABC-type dipeptide/oligopeptide/nickel transport system permease subunit